MVPLRHDADGVTYTSVVPGFFDPHTTRYLISREVYVQARDAAGTWSMQSPKGLIMGFSAPHVEYADFNLSTESRGNRFSQIAGVAISSTSSTSVHDRDLVTIDV